MPKTEMSEDGFRAEVQVSPDHYQHRYEPADRWANYGVQVGSVLKCQPSRVLEIGLGNGTVTAVLRSRGIDVTTCDLDPALKPDLVGSVHELGRCVAPKSFDVVLCAQVLEHLPFDLLAPCCRQLGEAARTHVILGLPCCPRLSRVSLELRLPRLGLYRLALGSCRRPRWKGDPEHHWCVDHLPYTYDRVVARIREALTIGEVIREPVDPFHVTFVCRPR